MACEMLHEVGANRAANGKRLRGRVSTLFKVNQPYSTQKRVLATQNTAQIRVRAHLNFYTLEFRTRTPRGGTRPTTRSFQVARPVGRVPRPGVEARKIRALKN